MDAQVLCESKMVAPVGLQADHSGILSTAPSSVQATRARDRLLRLMGTDDVHINDIRYMKTLREKVWQEYEAQMDAAEAVRAQAERDRLRRLMVDGVITVDDMRGDVCMMREYRRYTQKLEKQQLKEGVILPSKLKLHTATTGIGKRRLSISEEKLLMWTARGEDALTNVSDTPSQVSAVRPNVNTLQEGRMLPGATDDVYAQSPCTSFQRINVTSSATGLDSQRVPGWLIYEHPIVIKMRYEENVDRLYTLAQQLQPHVGMTTLKPDTLKQVNIGGSNEQLKTLGPESLQVPE